MDSQQGGQGEINDHGLYPRTAAKLERVALAYGWLQSKDGEMGLDQEKLAKLATKNYLTALTAQDPRAVAACTRNVIAMVGQVQEQEKRDAGGEHLNVHMDGEIATIRERIVRKREEATVERNGTNGVH